jgi:hypothetical protein
MSSTIIVDIEILEEAAVSESQEKCQRDEVTTKLPIGYVISSVSIFCLIVVGFFYWHWHKSDVSENLESWGQFGDFFGGILNPIIGLSSVILLAYTLRQNNHALSMTKQELANSTAQLKISGNALAEQSRVMKHDQTLNLVFRILDKFDSSLNELSSGNGEHKEKIAFRAQLLRDGNWDQAMGQFSRVRDVDSLVYFVALNLKFLTKPLTNHEDKVNTYTIAFSYLNRDMLLYYYVLWDSKFTTTRASYEAKAFLKDLILECLGVDGMLYAEEREKAFVDYRTENGGVVN